MLARAQECAAPRRDLWIAAASLIAGTAVWATHFMAMLAYEGGYPIAYDLAITSLSVLVSVLASWASFTLAFRWTGAVATMSSGVAFGIGIALMHFVGMGALDSPGHLTYSTSMIILAVMLSAGFGALSMLAVRQLSGWIKIIAGTVLISLTVCALHFTAMAGLVLVPDPTVVSNRLLLIDRAALAAVVAAVSSVIVLLGCAAAIIDRLLTDVRGLADASLEGLFIVHRGLVLEVNESALALTGLERGDMLGRHINEIVAVPARHLEQPAVLSGAIGTLSPLTGRKTEVEVFLREIEYRGRPCCVMVLRDMTERRRAERLVDHMARHDPLTDLLNRREFDRHLAKLTATEKSLALVCLDLDNFKLVNDIGGHAAGDDILRRVAGILRAAVTESGLLFRLGGDEFAVIQTGQMQPLAARELAKKVLTDIEALSASLELSDFGASAGVALLPSTGIEAETLHYRADTALYWAKDAGRGQVRFFEDQLSSLNEFQKAAKRIPGVSKAPAGSETRASNPPTTIASAKAGIVGI
jgi:diguanylate cyclase (GGDEF)-like protein/PAS domain S-box-containing protein